MADSTYRRELGSALTPRELEVLSLHADGHTGVQVAQQLHVSYQTVKSHAKHARERLGATTTAQAVRMAIEKGII